MEATQQFIFKCIHDFVVALDSVRNEDNVLEYDGGRCYRFLLDKTANASENERQVAKHISLFKEYCFVHRKALLNRNKSVLRANPVQFSDKVYISFDTIFNEIEDDEQVCNTIFKHLMIIYIYTHPQDVEMKEAYSTLAREDSQQLNLVAETPAKSVITDLVDKLKVIAQSGEFDNVANPMDIIQKMFTSKDLQQVCKDTMEEMSSGRISIPELLSAVTSLQQTNKGDNNLSFEGFDMNTINMLSSLFM